MSMTKIDTQRLRELSGKWRATAKIDALQAGPIAPHHLVARVLTCADELDAILPALIARIAELEERVATMESVQSDALDRATDRIIAAGLYPNVR